MLGGLDLLMSPQTFNSMSSADQDSDWRPAHGHCFTGLR
jgi:hypothetical protein